MTNKNEMIFINKILNTELTIRKTAKQFGLRRDDLIRRMEEALAGDEENLKQLKLVIVINKMLFDNLSMQEATKELNMTEKELDKKILSTLANNPDKLQRYKDYKNPKQTRIQKEAKALKKKCTPKDKDDAKKQTKNKNSKKESKQRSKK